MEENVTTVTSFESGSKARTARLLLIDDDATTTHMLSILLQRQGYITAMVNDSREALGTIRQFRPDLILLDINMPTFNGYQIALAVRADSALARIPIVAATSLDDDEHLRRSLEVGIHHQITKPFYTNEFNQLVDQLVQK